MRLTERDLDVIEAVHYYRVLKQNQLEALFFGSRATAQFRLEKLYDHGFLDRKFLPVALGAGRSPTLYVLDRRGAELLRAERGYDNLTFYHTSKDLSAQFLDHTLAINDIMVAVVCGCRRHGFQLEIWRGENQIKGDYDRVTIRGPNRLEEAPILPDSYFTVVAQQRRHHFFLEVDRGTMPSARFRVKVLAYLAYHRSGGYERRYGTQSLRILTVVPGEKRLAQLQQATEAAGGNNRFWFTTAEYMTETAILTAPVWQLARTEGRRALFEVDSSSP